MIELPLKIVFVLGPSCKSPENVTPNDAGVLKLIDSKRFLTWFGMTKVGILILLQEALR